MPSPRRFATALLLCPLLLCGAPAPATHDFPDLADGKAGPAQAGTEYRIGASGVVGSYQDQRFRVTRILPDSPGHGKIAVGDIVRGYQYRGVGSSLESFRKITVKRIFRLGRDWDWHLYLTVERPALRGGRGNTLTYDLIMPRPTDKTYHFGPTGFFGEIHNGSIRVVHVAPKSPADGKLSVGDRIVAVDGEPIAGDVFSLFTRRIDHAETRDAGGNLALTVQRPPAPPEADTAAPPPIAVDLTLSVLGTYSPTMPVNCPKTDAIITRTADSIVERGIYGRLGTSLIALLATGEKKYIDHVRGVIHAADWAKPDIELPITAGMVSWQRAYRLITLCEYYLLTRDETVLPALRTLANTIARGQDAAGLWNHQAASPAANFGQLHGRLFGYGAINQTSVALWIGLILAQECGIADPEVQAAIDKTHALYSYWVERGKLPYGNHGAGEDFFTNNGTSGSVAVAFALLDDTRGASFFSRMSAAATREILTGHTGPWFNIFWSGLGANVAGPETAKAHARELHWLRTVTRTWDNRFLHMEAWGCKPGGHSLGSSGSTLLNLAAPRRALRITGRDMNRSLWLDADAARATVGAATIDYAASSVPELLDLLGHALPPVRTRAAEMLAIRDARVTPQLRTLLSDGTRHQRIGAIHAIAALKISAVDALMAIVRDNRDDLWIRQLALRNMCRLEGAEKHTPELLAMLAGDKEYDVQGRFDADLGAALVTLTDSDPYAAGLDRDLLYRAVGKLLDHKRQEARGNGMRLLEPIPVEELHRIVDKMITVIEDKDRTYVSYHGDAHRQNGLNILYELNIDESLDLTVNTINEKVGRGWRAKNRKQFMKTWGREARRLIPRIREVLGAAADEFIQIVESAKTEKTMISLEDAKRLGQAAAD